MEKDPICGMNADPKTAISAEHSGRTYYFCSAGCRAQFQANPAQYARP